ncbi:MAG: ribBA [Rhodospirillales bacterium]|nr:ribBA [Rhodospirillales bacterium]
MEHQKYLSSIEEIIEDARNGRMFILVDDEDRENEGDLVIPAQMATPDAINFMAKHGRGLICLAMTRPRIEQLGLPAMSPDNGTRHQTAFTVSIEAREGVSTGISASDRARTIAAAIDATKGREAITTPGHVFPLMARDGGVLVRTGHTEASVDISRLAGLNPAGVICEIMKDDGTMARMPDLVAFAQRHGLKIATIADLIAYRLRHDRIAKPIAESKFETRDAGTFRCVVYRNEGEVGEHLALIKGDLSGPEPVLVRVQAFNIFDDMYSVQKSLELHTAMRMINEAGRGAIVLIRSGNPSVLSARVRSNFSDRDSPYLELRDYGTGAQIVLDLGIRDMILLSNTKRTMIAIEGYGLKIVEQRPIKISTDLSSYTMEESHDRA